MGRGGIDEDNPARKIPSSDYRHYRYSPLESEAVLLAGINVCAHFRSQLKDPLPIKPALTLTQRLPSPITDICIPLNEPTDAVSEVFPSLPENHLHIIVKLPGKQIYGHLCVED